MPRRKKPPPQRKLQQITDASGWTHVIKGPPGTRDLKITDLNPEYPTSKEATYTLETYLDRFRTHYTPSWKQSDCFKNLSRIFEQDILPSENIQITQCVCLGLGSMTAFGSENSSYELAALISMLEILGMVLMPQIQQHNLNAIPAKPEFTGKKHRIQEIVFQDPIFNSVDVAVLQSLGYTVVETPDAFSKLNSTTFLFAPHLECFNYATALEAATPVLSVGSDLERYAEG